jgi:hypothetical protein
MKVAWPSWVRSSRKASAAQVARGRMHDSESKAGGHGGVDGVAAGAQDFNAGVGGQMMHADHHAVLGADRLLVKIRDHVLRALLGDSGKRKKRKCGASEDGQMGSGFRRVMVF